MSVFVEKFVSFDLETSGTIPGVDEILEISAVRFHGDQVVAKFTTFVKNTKPIPAGASAVNGIYENMLLDAPCLEEVLPKFVEFCGEDLMVAHNAAFDADFLKKAFLKYEISGPQGLIVCSLNIARKLLPGQMNYKLGTLLSFFKIEVGTPHRAEADSIGCGMLFLRLMRKIELTGRVKPEQLSNLTGKNITFPKIKREPKQMGFFGE